MKFVKDNRGATLVELMTSIAIFGIIAAAALGLLIYATNVNSDVTAEVIEANRVYQVLDLLKTQVAESTRVMALKAEGTEEIVGIVTDPQGEGNVDSFKEKYIISEGVLYLMTPTEGSQPVALFEGIISFDIVEYDQKYAKISFTTTDGNDYTITLSCKNG